MTPKHNKQKAPRKPDLLVKTTPSDKLEGRFHRPPPRHMTDWRMSSATDMEEKHAALVSCCWTASSSAFCSAVRKSCARTEGLISGG